MTPHSRRSKDRCARRECPTSADAHRCSGPQYAAFISYNHEYDAAFATRLLRDLEGFERPIWRARTRSIWQDDANLATTPAIWESIKKALDDSRFLIVLLSPGAAKSVWVGREITHVLSTRERSKLCLILTSGWTSWTQGPQTPPEECSVPEVLSKLYANSEDEPFVIDMRRFRSTPRGVERGLYLEKMASLLRHLRF